MIYIKFSLTHILCKFLLLPDINIAIPDLPYNNVLPIVLDNKRKRSTEIIYLYVSYNKNNILHGYLLCICRYIYVGVVSSMYG